MLTRRFLTARRLLAASALAASPLLAPVERGPREYVLGDPVRPAAPAGAVRQR